MAVNLIVPGRAGKVPTCPPNADKIAWHAQRVARVSALVKVGKEKPDALGAEMLYLLKAADFNFVYLAPFFYPQYLQSKTDGMLPLQFSRRRFARDVMAFNPGGISVVAGSRQLGKTTLMAARTDMRCTLLPHQTALYVAPRPDQVKTFADRYKELAEQNVSYTRSNSRGPRHNLYYREYGRNSWVKMIYCLTHANNARGNAVGDLLVDEAQGFEPSLEPELLQVIRRNPMPTFMVTGTALTKDTYLETKYQESSQGTYVHRCPSCGIDNDLGEVEHVLKMIRPKGLCCRKCNTHLDPSAALLSHRSKEQLEVRNIGIRVPQVAIPDLVNDSREWIEIYAAIHGPNLGKAIQEVLGIPLEEGDRELSLDDLKGICTLGPVAPKPSKYRFVISGCDWGGSDYNPSFKTKKSNTAHVMYGVTHEGKREILHMAIHSGKAYGRVIAEILATHVRLGGTHIGSDAGMGQFYNNAIRMSGKVAVARHYVIQYGGNPGRVVAPMKTEGVPPNHFVAHKTETLSVLFSRIKNKEILCFDWEKSKLFLEEFMNVHRDLQETATGQTGFRYRKHGEKTDDIVQAFNFAQIAESIATGEELVPSAGILGDLLMENEVAAEIRRQLDQEYNDHESRSGWNGHRGYAGDY